MDYKLITFKTNHTIIAEVEKQTDTHITLKNPLQVIMQPSNTGTTLGFVPFLEYCKEFKSGIKFSFADILVITEPVDELAENYRQVFSNIQIVSQMPKL